MVDYEVYHLPMSNMSKHI